MGSHLEEGREEDLTTAKLDAAYSFRWAEAMEALDAALSVLGMELRTLGLPAR